MASMSIRALLVATVLALAGYGGDESTREVSLVAPVWIGADIQRFERESGCRVDLRVYDEGEDLNAIAERRDVDIVARPALRPPIDETEQFVRVFLSGGADVTIPRELASAFPGRKEPAPPRSIRWEARPEGDNEACARRWIAYATSQ